MVHYDRSANSIQRPPPSCPKCGSHRTQIVGLSDEGQTVVVRCTACGERSEVKSGNEVRRVELEEAVEILSRVIDWQHT